MARFNTPGTATRTTNLAGGEAFIESPELELASMVLTSMVADQFYRTAGEQIDKLKALVKANPLFAAKCAVYARNEVGMRSVTHVIAGEIALQVKGEKWTRPFFDAVVRRPDDITEILSYVIAQGKRRPLPNSLKDGLARAFGKFNTYSLAKYRGEGKGMSLVDAVNLVHPKPNERNGEALTALVAGKLTSTDTWEAMLSAAGQVEDAESDVAEAKSDAWGELIKTRKIGYFALLRNLRNILTQADAETRAAALELLCDESLIKSSLVMPFRFATAATALSTVADSRDAISAVSKATDIALANVPHLDGKTLVMVDASGSMMGGMVGGPRSTTRICDVAALFAAVLYRTNNSDLMLFDDKAQYVQLDPNGSTLGIAGAIRAQMRGGGTDFKPIFAAAQGKYDRIVILSDMQGWVDYTAPTKEFAEYKTRTGASPKVFSFDLQGYGTTQLPEREVYALAGFSDRVFEVMALLEGDKNALVNKINEVAF